MPWSISKYGNQKAYTFGYHFKGEKGTTRKVTILAKNKPQAIKLFNDMHKVYIDK